MTDILANAIQTVSNGLMTFCKFLSANDTGETGGHQSGIYLAKQSSKILFDTDGIRGENKEKWVTINWQNDFDTNSRFIYYGVGTRNEYRITNFGRNFPFLCPEYTGALFILVKVSDVDYKAYILNTESDINQFLDTVGVSPVETNKLINISGDLPETLETSAIQRFIEELDIDFPTSDIMSKAARNIQNSVYNHKEYIITNPDQKLIEWTDVEYRLFRALEHKRYGPLISGGFDSVDEFVAVANQVLNRRKSRAGKSLEHHLSAIFDANNIMYDAQVITEGNKKPDFLFPSYDDYHNLHFPCEKLNTLAAKTTCKDRWRQILNEADRLRGRTKFLCTLQQGISGSQMEEMQAEGVVLVVPEKYISTYPHDKQNRIWTVRKFVGYIKECEGI